MKLTIESTVEKGREKAVYMFEKETLFDCIKEFVENARSNLAGLVELKAEDLRERVSQMTDDEEVVIQAFEEVMRTYGIQWSMSCRNQ